MPITVRVQGCGGELRLFGRDVLEVAWSHSHGPGVGRVMADMLFRGEAVRPNPKTMEKGDLIGERCEVKSLNRSWRFDGGHISRETIDVINCLAGVSPRAREGVKVLAEVSMPDFRRAYPHSAIYLEEAVLGEYARKWGRLALVFQEGYFLFRPDEIVDSLELRRVRGLRAEVAIRHPVRAGWSLWY